MISEEQTDPGDDMLAAFEAEAGLYDVLSGRLQGPDESFYVSLAERSGGPVLEFGCGSGRILLPCARAAGAAVGVDLSRPMLEKGRERAKAEGLSGAVELVEGDFRSIRLGRTFPLVVTGGQTLFFLPTDDALSAALETIRAHLSPGGNWAADAPVLRTMDMVEHHDRLKFVTEIRHPKTDRRVAIWHYHTFEEAAQIHTRRRITETLDESGVVVERRHSVQRLYFRHPNELRRLVRDAGFEIVEEYGDYHGNPFGGRSEFLVWVARAL